MADEDEDRGRVRFAEGAVTQLKSSSDVRHFDFSHGALGCGVARDLQRAGFGVFGSQHGLPFGWGFLDRKVHDEQLMEMEEAQSGGKPAWAV